MKKRLLFIAMLASFSAIIFAQPVIDQNDMPVVGDTIRFHTLGFVTTLDPNLTGTNYLWDFSSYISTQERADTFVGVSSTPLSYQFEFNDVWLYPDYVATVALSQPDITMIPNVQYTQVFNYFKASATAYAQVGQGASVNGIPMPIQYHDPDLLYKFPMALGDTDSSYYEYHMTIPTLGYYGNSKKRVNNVDGWGTVITPYDTFPCIRVKSTSFIRDTIHLDSFGFGFAIPRTEIEYKWLADNMGLPVFKATKTGGGMGGSLNIEYLFKPNYSHAAISDYPYDLTFVSLYPNPADENTALNFALARPADIEIDILDMTGEKLYSITHKLFAAGFHIIPIAGLFHALAKGIYLVNFHSPNCSRMIKMTVP